MIAVSDACCRVLLDTRVAAAAAPEVRVLISTADRIPHLQPLYDEALRPQFHMSQMRGWNNDPNGMCYFDGRYHFFWQSNPAGHGWANMYWGHATSPDMVHWTEQAHALRPFGGSVANRHRSMAVRECFSGSGNVAQYTVEKLIEFGAKPVTLSDSGGTILDEDGIDAEKLAWVMDLKNVRRGRIKEYADKYGVEYFEDKRPWIIKCDIAMPNATQNEINAEEAHTLVKNGCICVAEGANMPSTMEAVEVFLNAGILYGPGKAANAGGVATSGLEMTQNSMRLPWSRKEVDERLHIIMKDIHTTCVKYGKKADGFINYVDGANIGGFVKVANAMLAQGLV